MDRKNGYISRKKTYYTLKRAISENNKNKNTLVNFINNKNFLHNLKQTLSILKSPFFLNL